eukprot:SAG11_NODE_12622_length_694_cov_0.954622_1_plen_82_part_00
MLATVSRELSRGYPSTDVIALDAAAKVSRWIRWMHQGGFPHGHHCNLRGLPVKPIVHTRKSIVGLLETGKTKCPFDVAKVI